MHVSYNHLVQQQCTLILPLISTMLAMYLRQHKCTLLLVNAGIGILHVIHDKTLATGMHVDAGTGILHVNHDKL